MMFNEASKYASSGVGHGVDATVLISSLVLSVSETALGLESIPAPTRCAELT